MPASPGATSADGLLRRSARKSEHITDAPIDIATEIFTRINVGGKSLSVFEIMVAKTYYVATGFDLSEKYS